MPIEKRLMINLNEVNFKNFLMLQRILFIPYISVYLF